MPTLLGIYEGRIKMEQIECKLCGKMTNMTGTKLCNGCWEVDSRLDIFFQNKKAVRHVLRKIAMLYYPRIEGRVLRKYLNENGGSIFFPKMKGE